MVAQALPREARTSAFSRAMSRATSERLVAYPNQDSTAWTCKSYTIVVTGRRCDDVACSCPAGQQDRICKHAVCVVAARKWGVRPVKPSVAVPTVAAGYPTPTDLPPSVATIRAGLR